MEPTIIDRLVQDNSALVAFLQNHGEISLVSDVENGFRRTLLLAAASFFESEIKDALLGFAAEVAGRDHCIVYLIQRKAIDRQYHTLFQWDRRNANHFFSHFGPAFSEFMSAHVKKDVSLDESIKSFLELGELRNQLVHENFATFSLEKTPEEIYEIFQRGAIFVRRLPHFLREFSAVPTNNS